jgi:hypothetical protein
MRPGQLIRTPILLAAGLFLTFTTSMIAQVQSQTTTTQGTQVHVVEVERGEVIYVFGHDLILKMDNGEYRHIANVPDSARATVDGKQIGIHDVKVGMKMQKTITTTATPTIITKVDTVTGKVFHVTPPLSVIPDHGGRNEPGVQDPGRPEVRCGRSDGGRLGSQTGDEGLGDKGHGDSGDGRKREGGPIRQDATASAAQHSDPVLDHLLIVRCASSGMTSVC